MMNLLKRNFYYRRLPSVLFIISFSIIFITIPLAATSLQDVQKQIETDVTYYARGSYDILVRPQNALHPLEKELGIVPENYIGFGEGGISIEQWQAILNREDIEIAAPVASLGYYTGVKSNIGYEKPTTATRYSTKFFTSDGMNTYFIGEEKKCIQLKSPVINRDHYKFEALFIQDDLSNYCRDGGFMVEYPPTYHLLVAVSPEQEQLLTGLDFSKAEDGNYQGMGAYYQGKYYPEARLIPVVELDDASVNLGVHSKIDELDLDENDTQNYRNRLGLVDEINPHKYEPREFSTIRRTSELRKLFEELISYPSIITKEFDVDLSPLLSPYLQNGIAILNNGKIEDIEQLMGDGIILMDHDMNYVSVYYSAGYPNYEKAGDRFIIKRVGEENGIPVFREIKKHGVELSNHFDNETSPPFILDPVGEVTVGEYKEKLASSPLGIYNFAPVIFKDGDKRIELNPTVSPGSFISAPASGVTNIEAAAFIKGDKPIDAIRVKIAGISHYTKETALKIEQVASEIEAMGFHVSIIAGASPQKLKLDVEGIGSVEESWTTLGAAGTIINEWNVTNIILAFSFFIVTFLYIINRMLFWEVTNRRDLMLLSQLGWKKQHILRLSRNELITFIVFSLIVAVPSIIGIQQSGQFNLNLYFWFVLAVILISGIIMTFIRLKFHKIIDNSTVNLKRNGRKRKGKRSLLVNNFIYYLKHIRSPFFQLMMVSALSTFVYQALVETRELTNITLLGEYINLQINEWHLVLMVAAYVLAIITLMEGTISLLKVREKEISQFRTIGWRRSHIFNLYLREFTIWSGVAIFIGVVISGLLFGLSYSFKKAALLILAVSFIGFYSLVLIFVSIILHYHLKRREATFVIIKD